MTRLCPAIWISPTGGWKRLEIGFSVEIEIAAVDENVVDITEQAAAGAAHQLAEKVRLRDRRMPVAQIARRVFDE
jgi:hypothetical protein